VRAPSYHLEAFFAPEQTDGWLNPNPDLLPALHEAEVIFGRDTSTCNLFIVFGRDVLTAIINSGLSRSVKTLITEIDQDEASDDLEKLLALMHVVKGCDDYQVS